MKNEYYFKVELVRVRENEEGESLRSVLAIATEPVPFRILKKDEEEAGPEFEEYLLAVHKDIRDGFKAFFRKCLEEVDQHFVSLAGEK